MPIVLKPPMDENYEVWEISLRMRIDRGSSYNPTTWDWYEILDLTNKEYVQLTGYNLIGKAIEIEDEFAPEYVPKDLLNENL